MPVQKEALVSRSEPFSEQHLQPDVQLTFPQALGRGGGLLCRGAVAAARDWRETQPHRSLRPHTAGGCGELGSCLSACLIHPILSTTVASSPRGGAAFKRCTTICISGMELRKTSVGHLSADMAARPTCCLSAGAGGPRGGGEPAGVCGRQGARHQRRPHRPPGHPAV